MSVAAAAGLWAAVWLRAAAALGFVAASASADQADVEIIEPSSWYKTEGHCQYNYDALVLEPLRFNLTAICGSRGCDSVTVRKIPSHTAVRDCRQWCNVGPTSCSLGCTVSEALHPAADEGVYQIEAEGQQYYGTAPKIALNICVNVQDHARVHFVGTQTTSATSESGSIVLNYMADGYPRPVSYELVCSQQRATSLGMTGRLMLTNLTVGVIRCTVVAYTDRRLAATSPLDVMIHVVSSKPSTSSSNANDADLRVPTSFLSTRSLMVESAGSTQQEFGGDAKDKVLIIATVIPCVVLALVSVFLVGCIVFKRRSEQLATICQDVGGSSAQRSAPQVASIINNSSTTYNYYGDHFEILGPGSFVVVHGSGQSNSSDVVHTLDADGGGC